MPGITAALNYELNGRGRVWEHATPAVKDDAFVVTLPPTTGGAAAEAGAAAEQLHNGMFVFVFQEAPIPDVNQADAAQKPVAATEYLGAMAVTSTNGNQVTLRRVQTLDLEAQSVTLDPSTHKPIVDAAGQPQVVSVPVFPEIAQALSQPTGTWSLFEKMPIDMRDAFKRVGGIDIDPQQENIDFNDYQTRYRAVLTKYMPPERFGLSLDNADQAGVYERLIDRHAFDWMRLSDIRRWIQEHQAERINKTFDPPNEEKYSRLRFNAKSNEFEIDTDAGNVTDGIFDIRGRAILQDLKYGGKIRLDKDTVIIVDPTTATALKARENVTEEAEVYVRQLDDFAILISEFSRNRELLFEKMLQLIKETAVLRATDADLRTQESQRTTLVSQLTEDSENLSRDLEAINQLLTTRTGEVADLKEQINKLYKVIIVRYKQIKERSELIMQTALTVTVRPVPGLPFCSPAPNGPVEGLTQPRLSSNIRSRNKALGPMTRAGDQPESTLDWEHPEYVWTVEAARQGQRLDQYLNVQFPLLSRSQIQKQIIAGAVRVDNVPVRPSFKLKSNNVITAHLVAEPDDDLVAEDIPLSVLFEDEDLVAIDKPSGMVVHPAKGHWKGTLAAALAFRFKQLSTTGGRHRPGIVHRLDRDTSGVILVAKNDIAHLNLTQQFEVRSVKKRYWAVVSPAPDRDRDLIELPIGVHPYQREKMAIRSDHPTSRSATTFFEVTERFRGLAVLAVQPKTGRTHQIRVHLAHIGTPILCDRLYSGRSTIKFAEADHSGPQFELSRQALHAQSIEFNRPSTNARMKIEAPVPQDLAELLQWLRRTRRL